MDPVQMVLDADENLFITDQGCHRVTVLSKEGKFVDKWGELGGGPGRFDRPAGIAFGPDGNLYVADCLNHRIQKYAKDGRFISQFGEYGAGPGQFNMPWGLAVDELGDVYVSDWRNDRVQKFDAAGKFIFKFGKPGTGYGELNHPAGICVDKDGDIYVCDWGNNRIQLFGRDGHFIQWFLGEATLSKSTLKRWFTRTARYKRFRESANLEQEKYFDHPRSVRVDDEGRMFVPDFEHYRIQVYQKEAYPIDEGDILPPFRTATLDMN